MRIRLLWAFMLASLVWAPWAQAQSVTLAWDYTHEPTNKATGFVLERCTGVACTAFVPVTAQPLPLAPLIYVDKTIVYDTTYNWRIKAVNATSQSSYGSPLTLTTAPVPPPCAPTNLQGRFVPGAVPARASKRQPRP